MAEEELKKTGKMLGIEDYKYTTEDVDDLTRRMNKLRGIASADGSLE